jgi:uncharacterized YccA/Bax inhibitor family protein
MAGNPALNRFQKAVQTPTVAQLDTMYGQPAYVAPRRYMTLDDVVTRTGAMLAVLFAAGTASWVLTPTDSPLPALLIGAFGGLALGLYISFTMKANAVTSLLYAAFEGVFLGAISHIFDNRYPGIVVQALTGTVMVAVGVLVAYRVGAIRVTPRFTRIVVFGLMIVNMIAYLFSSDGLGLRSGGALAIVFSLLCIGIAAMNLVIDFDVIEQGIKRGADEKFAWFASFSLMVTLVWLYLEILRLLGYLRNS